MSQRPDENATARGNNVDNSTVPNSPENPAGEATATIAILDSDDELPPVSDFIDLCVSPSTSAAAAGNSSSSILKNATEQSQQTDAATATHAAPLLECPICLQTCIHPARLPCGHIFCFLCVKGVAYKNRRCAMCRREIPPEFLDHPQLVNGIDDICTTKATEDGYQWYYEGRNGWWQYDDRTSQDIEESYKKGEKSCTILVAGYVYIVDLEAMLQQRQNEPTRCRRVKRDLATIPKKGVAGLRIEGNTVTTDTNFATQLQQQQHQSATDVRLRLNSSDFISTMAATDAAIRIASDIIGSTLAHADELTRGLSANSVGGGGINDESSSSGEHALTRSLSNIHNAVVEEPEAALRSTAVTSNSNANLHTIQDLMRSATEDLLGTTQQVIETNQHSLDLFEQALNDFQALTLRNMSDSSDDDDNELVVAENDEPAQQDTNSDANRSLRF